MRDYILWGLTEEMIMAAFNGYMRDDIRLVFDTKGYFQHAIIRCYPWQKAIWELQLKQFNRENDTKLCFL